jgi:hypothetical protein
LRRATFQTGGTGVLKVWAHRVTPEGNSVALPRLVNMRWGGETRRFGLRLSDREIVLSTTERTCQVDITFSQIDDQDPLSRLL